MRHANAPSSLLEAGAAHPGRVDRQPVWREGGAGPHLEDDEFGDVISRTMPGISSRERIKSMHPLPIALAGLSGPRAVSSLCAMITPPTSLISQRASAPSPSKPETMTANELALPVPSQRTQEDRYDIGPPLGLDIGLSRNSPFRT